MLRQIRDAAPVRAALALAAILAVGASAGLHPEPDGTTRSTPAGISAFSVAAAPHACLACLAQATAVVPLLSGVLLRASTSRPAITADVSHAPARFVGRDRSGRSPPAGS